MTLGNNLNNNPGANGWDVWANKVLSEQKRLAIEVARCHKAISEQSREMAELRASLGSYLSRMRELCDDFTLANSELTKFQVYVSGELSTLRTKSGVWGATGALLVLLLAWLMSQLGG